MARTQSVTEEMIEKAAFELATEEGIEAVTARKVATKAGCSTQPIFRLYENMEQLQSRVISMAGNFFSDFYENYPKADQVPFVDLGRAFIDFAKKYEKLFALLFASHYKKSASTYEYINGGNKMFVLKELRKMQGVDAPKAGAIFSDFWTYVNGMACMVLNGDMDLTDEEIRDKLAGMFERLSK